jgi:twitching motility protein PilT
LREDPDVILVGEMRDLESIRFALTLAETGHVVFATLHTNDTAQAMDRLIDVFPAEQQPQIRVQLASTLTGVVYQRLLPRLGGGLVAAHEVLVGTTPVRNLVKEGKTNQLRNQIVTGAREGMQTLEQSLSELVTAGVVSYDTTRRGLTRPWRSHTQRGHFVTPEVAAHVVGMSAPPSRESRLPNCT